MTTTDTTDRSDQDTASAQRSNPNFIDNDLDRVPDKAFRDYDLDDRLVDALEAQGIAHPFPIQELTLPVALQGQDIIGQARTGTGKTLGFGLPMIQRLDPNAPHTQCLIVTPTRELCIQVHDQLRICESMGFTSTTVYGGVGYEEQTEALEAGVDIVVGTPGRLLDMLGRGILDISSVSCVILDEADEMLDMGFLPDVERLLEAANPQGPRHTMLFSATMPASVVKLARRYTDSPLFMGADSVQHETAPTVEQHFFQVYRMDKPRVLARILQQPDRGNAYVFTRTKAMADRLVRELDDLGVDAIAIHGDLRQTAREKNLTKFRDGRTSVLCATEVAARGIDVDNVTHVFNYDIPDDEKMYLHRIGRTARAGAKGVAVTFAEHNELARLTMIQKAVQQDDMDELQTHEVFSTSDVLTELFDLPDGTPWDHMSDTDSSNGRSSNGRRSSDGRSSGGRSSGGRSSRRSQSRSRNRVEHDSGDDDGRDRSRSRTVLRDDEGDRDRRRSRSQRRAGDDESAGTSSDRSRSRERSGGGRSDQRDRSRSRSSSRDGADQRSRTRSEADGTGDDGRSGGTRRTTGGARVRARGGKPVDGGQSRGGKSGDSRSGGSRSGGGRSGGSRSRNRSDGGTDDRSDGASGKRTGSRGSDGGSGSNGGGSNRSSGGGRGRSRKGGKRGDGGSRGRGKGNGRNGGSSTRRTTADGWVDLPSDVKPTRTGRAARGEGTPRHERSVRMDGLA